MVGPRSYKPVRAKGQRARGGAVLLLPSVVREVSSAQRPLENEIAAISPRRRSHPFAPEDISSVLVWPVSTVRGLRDRCRADVVAGPFLIGGTATRWLTAMSVRTSLVEGDKSLLHLYSGLDQRVPGRRGSLVQYRADEVAVVSLADAAVTR